MPRDVGDIGFPIELHPRDPDTAWVFPMDGTDVWPRTSPDGQPGGVRHARRRRVVDAAATTGLPERAWFTVKRQAMTVDDARSGRRVLRHDERRDLGEHRRGRGRGRCIAEHLPEIYSVEYADPARA